jgi:hypothetical protein
MAATKDFKRVLKNMAMFFAPAAFGPLIATISGLANVPPLLSGTGLKFVPIAAGAIFLVYAYVRAYRPSTPRMLRFALLCLMFSVLLSVIHSAVLLEWTVADPQSGSQRFSVGFGMAEWSLTVYGRSLAARENITTPDGLMMADAAFHAGGPERLWKSWAIRLSSITLALMFLSSLAMWSAGWGTLAVHMTDKETPPTRRVEDLPSSVRSQ